MPPRIQFKHIKRAEEIPPPAPPEPAPSFSPVRRRRPDLVYKDPGTWPSAQRNMMSGWHFIRVSRHIMNHEAESTWRTYVYDHACQTGYQGTMHQFFCRDCQETADPDVDGVRFSWRETPERGTWDYDRW